MFAEFLSTGLLLLTITMCNAVINDPLHTPLAIAGQVVALTFVGAGNGNPAIAIGVTVIRLRRAKVAPRPGSERLALLQFLSWVLMEVLGATCGALVGWALLTSDAQRQLFPAPIPAGGDASSIPRALLAEFVFTFQLVYVMIFTCVAKEFEKVNVNRFLGPCLGCVAFVGMSVAGPISGAALNPAVATSLQVVQCMMKVGASSEECRPLSYIWLYWLAELFAGVCAALCFLLASNEADPTDCEELCFVSPHFATDSDVSLQTNDNIASTKLCHPQSTERDSLLRRSSACHRITRASCASGMRTLVDLE